MQEISVSCKQRSNLPFVGELSQICTFLKMTYGFSSCIMGKIVRRVVISFISQLLCSYSTLPLYGIVTQMGSSFKKAIFEEHIFRQVSWDAEKVKKRKRKAKHEQRCPWNPDEHCSSKRNIDRKRNSYTIEK